MLKANNNDLIYKTLEYEIITLKIKPGESLSENELCARFEVSRTPIRGALQRLEENGFVTIVPHKSTTVTLIDYDIVNQLIYQRVAVESMVFRDFMRIASPMQTERMRHLITQSEALIAGDFRHEEFYHLDGQLHSIWYYAVQKDYLWKSIQQPQSHYTRFRMLDVVDSKHCHLIIDEHIEMLQLAEAKNEAAIEALFIKHLYGGVTRLGDRIYTDLKDYFIQE